MTTPVTFLVLHLVRHFLARVFWSFISRPCIYRPLIAHSWSPVFRSCIFSRPLRARAACSTRKLSSIEDRGQTNRVVTVTCDHQFQSLRSIGSKD